MISLPRPVSTISNVCLKFTPAGVFARQNDVHPVELTHRSVGKFSSLASVSSNCEFVKFSGRLQQKLVLENGKFSMCATASSGDMPGQNSDSDSPNEISSAAKESNGFHEAKDFTSVKLQVQEEGGVSSVKNTDLLVEEFKLEESGQLSSAKVSIAGTSRSPTLVDKVSIRIKPYFQLLIQSVHGFSIKKFIRESGKKKPSRSDVNLNPAVYEPKKGVDPLIQWTSTELTLQHAEMMRIAKDTRYLVWAFGLFGLVRVLEAVVLTFTSRPFHIRKLLGASNALDPLTVAWLAHGMRQPIVAILKVDPSDLEEVNRLKIKFWKELHAFYERQWKVMATLGIVRLLNLIATHHPAAQYVTHKLQVLWNVTLSLPLF